LAALGLALSLALSGCADDLELREARVPAQAMPLHLYAPTAPGGALVVWYSGVGGWGATDAGVARGLEAAGLPVVGVDSVRYFAHRRSPQTAAADLAALIDRYGAAWRREGVVLVGYSFGGAALPLILPQLPTQARARVRLVVLIAPSPRSELVMRPWTLFDVFQPDAPPLRGEARALAGLRSLCIADPDDHSADCAALPGTPATAVSGGHRLKGSLDAVARAIASAAAQAPP
jgi:type IV secretory pathway VirJ component